MLYLSRVSSSDLSYDLSPVLYFFFRVRRKGSVIDFKGHPEFAVF
jgi:hypothetical protein